MHMRSSVLALALTATITTTASAARPTHATLTVDTRDAPRRILHATLTLPVTPGPLTLRYPKWIPGEHGPTGPIVDVAGVVITAGTTTTATAHSATPIPWHRDDVDLYAFHLDVPASTTSLTIAFDYLAPAERDLYSSGGSTTDDLVALEWNLVVLYPDNVSQHDFIIAPRLILPHNWHYGTALEPTHAAAASASASSDTVDFKPVSLETLVDSPVIAGAHFRTFSLGPASTSTSASASASPDAAPPHTLDVVADSDADLALDPAHLEALKRLVVEAGALFSSRHYARYHFLLTLSDRVAHFGLEHHQSSDNRTRERFFIDHDARLLSSGLLPHEFVHSWNGKFRRPLGLATGGFDKPMKGDLLWVYEGLTSYLGWVLTSRAGLVPADWWRDELAQTAASMDTRSGRKWRPLADTAIGAQLLHRSSPEHQSWRRSSDYYPEGVLLWLDVDVTIRQRSNGAKSLDDFVHAFYGGPNHGAEVKPYTLDDITSTLDSIVANDWRAFFAARVDQVQPHAPLGGITGGGWRLVYTDKPNERIKATGKLNKIEDWSYTLGFTMREDGNVADVIPGTPAAKAGLAPAMKVLGVDGRKLAHESLADAVKLDRGTIELLVTNSDFYKLLTLHYRGSAKNPHLEREAGKPDLLQAIGHPVAAAAAHTSISPAR
jgi:predicted metalloprotease with PDZ domain